ncbi:MAG: rRNA maturation RNase YbeY [Verrucomicrobiota bacterium]|jgi:probable rRNA maturation factor
MNIVIANRQRTKKVEARLLKQIAEALFAELKISEVKLGINLVAAPEMALLNETFLKHTGSTDVITFDYADKTEGAILSGEIFVCVDEAIIHAKKFKTKWQSEIVRYIVHGVLHLLGHDDLKAKRRRKMKREENCLLRGLAKKFSLAQIAGRSKISA